MAGVVWTDEALDDLKAIVTYYKRKSPSYAASIADRLYESVKVLEKNSRLGRKVPEIDHDLVRELIVERYRVIYQLDEKRVEVVTILHSRQDLLKKFKDKGL